MILLSKHTFYRKKSGLIVAMLIDKNNNSTHAVDINLDKRLIYDCKEKYVMELSINNLSVYCGQNMDFDYFCKFGEL